jgi:hypothetical protein
MEGFVPALKWLNLILTYVYCGLTMSVSPPSFLAMSLEFRSRPFMLIVCLYI